MKKRDKKRRRKDSEQESAGSQKMDLSLSRSATEENVLPAAPVEPARVSS